MGAIKTGTYTEQQEALANTAKALAHPGRIAIMHELLENRHCKCGPLAEKVGLAQSTISQHLKELKSAGLIKGSIEDSRMCYCLSDEGIAAMITFLNQINEATKLNIDNCC
jgi:ArsR family transcriptional regulator, arsenate/arsenite/antimonite-responsive transcriptional repressor